MAQLIAESVRVAKKDHADDSAEWIIEAIDFLTEEGRLKQHELKAINELRNNNWKIKKGQIYIKQWNKMHGQTFTFKTLPIILKICLKYKLYP